jgi:hypothetical protein
MTPTKTRAALTGVFLIVWLFVAPGFSVAAGSSDRHPADQGRPVHRTVVHYRHFGGYMPLYGYVGHHGQYVPGAGDKRLYGPGYVFVPGHGILDETCNLPTSTCTNEYRDVR